MAVEHPSGFIASMITEASQERRAAQPRALEAPGYDDQQDFQAPVGRRLVERLDNNPVARHVLADDSLTSDDESDRHTRIGRSMKMTWLMNQVDLTTDKEWYKCRDDLLHPRTDTTVLQYSAWQTDVWLSSKQTIVAHDQALKMAILSHMHSGMNQVERQALIDGMPSSKLMCDAAIGVQPAERYELHVCWNPRCRYWWLFATESKHGDGNCMGKCQDCYCPKCDTPRFKGPDGQTPVGPNKCYFFYDVLEHFFHEQGLCNAITTAQQQRVASNHGIDPDEQPSYSPQSCAESINAAVSAGFDLSSVCIEAVSKLKL